MVTKLILGVKIIVKKIEPESTLQTRKQLIVESALVCFIDKGYNQTGVRDIAAKAGISLGNLYNHFSSKEAVLQEIAKLESEELLPFIAILEEDKDPINALIKFINAYMVYASLPENVLISFEIIGEALRNPSVAEIFEMNRIKLINALSKLIEKGIANGYFRQSDNVRETTKIVLDAIEGQAIRSILEIDKNSSNAQIELKTFIQFALKK